MNLRSGLAVLTASLLLPPFPQAWAWGNEGHRIIADIAWDHLTPATREKLQPFLEGGDLASISTWADDIRPDRPETALWHYVNIPPDSAGYDPKYCPNDNCVVAQINKFAQILEMHRSRFPRAAKRSPSSSEPSSFRFLRVKDSVVDSAASPVRDRRTREGGFSLVKLHVRYY